MNACSLNNFLSGWDDASQDLSRSRAFARETFHCVIQAISDTDDFPPKAISALPMLNANDATEADLQHWWVQFRTWLAGLDASVRDRLGRELICQP